MEKLEEKQARLKRELEEVNKEIEREKEIKVGDFVKRTADSHGGMEVGDIGEVIQVDDGYLGSVYIKEYGGLFKGHSKRFLEKVSAEEAEEYMKSREENSITLSSGYLIKVNHRGFTDQDGYNYEANVLRKLINPGGFGGRSITVISATYKIGCQEITLEEIKQGLEIYEKIVAQKLGV